MERPYFIASCSFGKDSLATILLAKAHGEPLDEAVYCEVMFDKDISGEVPEHRDFIYETAIPALERMGIKIIVLRSKKTYVKNFSVCENDAPENAANETLSPTRGAPAANQRSVCGGERRKEWSGRSPRREAGTKQSGISSDEEAVQTTRTGQSRVPVEGSLDCPNRAANDTEKKETESSETNRILPQPLAVKNCAPFRPAPPDIHSAPFPPALPTRTASLGSSGGPKGRDLMDEMDWIRDEIRENIDYEGLIWDHPCDSDIFEGYVELMTEACCSTRETVRICGQELPTAVVRSRFLKLNREHVEYVRDCLCNTTAAIGNIKAYTLAALYNAPATMGQYYTALASRDLGMRTI